MKKEPLYRPKYLGRLSDLIEKDILKKEHKNGFLRKIKKVFK